MKISEPLIIGSGNLIASVLSGIFWFMLANITDVQSYGEVGYYISIATLGSIISLLGLNITSITYIPKGNTLIFKESSYIVLITSSIAAIIITFTTNKPMVALLLIAMNSYIMTVDEALANGRYKKYSLFAILNKSMHLILALLLYYPFGINGIIIGHAIPSLILGYRLYTSIKPSFKEVRSKFVFTLHTYSLSLSQVVPLYIDKLFIAPIFGFAILGVYQLGFQFLILLSVLPTTLLQYLLPEESKGNKKEFLRRIGFITSIILAIAAYLIMPYIIENLFPTYIDGLSSFRIMLFGIIPLTANSLLNSSLLANERSRYVLIGVMVYVGSLIPLMMLLGNALGITGLATAMVLSLSLQSITLYIIKIRLL